MIQITPQMRILLAVEPVDFRRGIDGLELPRRPRFATRALLWTDDCPRPSPALNTANLLAGRPGNQT